MQCGHCLQLSAVIYSLSEKKNKENKIIQSADEVLTCACRRQINATGREREHHGDHY